MYFSVRVNKNLKTFLFRLNTFDMNEYISSLVRHGLTSVGGSLVAKGLITATAFDQVIGAVIVLAGVLWSVASKAILKKLHLEQVATALMTPPPPAAPEGSAASEVSK